MTLFGAEQGAATMYLPLVSCEWGIDGIAKSGQYTNTVLMGLTLDDNENIDIRRCFNDITHIFAFGRDLKSSAISVSLLCFLGKECKSGMTGFDDISEMREAYEQKRIYKNPQSLNIYIDTLTLSGFLIGMHVGNFDTANETCTVTFTFLPDEGV